MLQRALDVESSYMNISQLQLLIRQERYDLLVWHDGLDISGAATVEFIDHPLRRVANCLHLGGRGIACREFLDALIVWCKSFGAVAIQGGAIESRMRLYRRFGFKPTMYLLELNI